MPLELAAYPAECIRNRHFQQFDIVQLERFYLPRALTALLEEAPVETREFIEDDNRGAILPNSIVTLDGTEFFLSVKGVGSTIDPYSWRTLDRAYAAELSDDPAIQARLHRDPAEASDRIITGEVWLRGSPYGGQGLDHATTAFKVSERADLTSVAGFLIAPVLRICFLPEKLEEQLRTIHWYRKYRGRMVQELRLVPSNVRIYFHGKSTVGNNIRHLFDLFSIDSNARALRFETNFVRSTVAMLTLFARTMTHDPPRGKYVGLDFDDVWLDKDAVIAPDGAAYFVDLEGIVELALDQDKVREKIEDQVHRSLYELTFAYEQIEGERSRRFGTGGSRKGHFEGVLREALKSDPFVRVMPGRGNVELEIRNNCQEESLYTRFRAVDA
ncbi:MAG: hypothetical protein WCB18_03120 [Thermoplasmata archaeon]